MLRLINFHSSLVKLGLIEVDKGRWLLEEWILVDCWFMVHLRGRLSRRRGFTAFSKPFQYGLIEQKLERLPRVFGDTLDLLHHLFIEAKRELIFVSPFKH